MLPSINFSVMCHNCLSTTTKSQYLLLDRPNQFRTYFPCGYCADCIRKKKSEWQLRSFYEAKDTFSRNGFVLFDTLTYCDDKLVYFHDIYPEAKYNAWDFMSFSRRDINLFFKQLRTNLLRGCHLDSNDCRCFGYRGRDFSVDLPSQPDSVGNVRYFLTSEYGTSDECNGRRCTHRPHYHILFFVTFDIDPWLFSQYVSASWLHGRTDGFPYKSRMYVENERVITSSNQNCLKLIRYVSKYVAKDMYLYRKLYNRCYRSFSIRNPNWQASYNKRLEFRRFKNQVLPFHLQSRGFGLAALKFEDISYIESQQAIRMPISSSGVVASIPLPIYFTRKLYYDCDKFNGKLRWLPNSKLLSIRKKNFEKSVVNLRNRLFLFDNTLGIKRATDIARYHLLWRGMLVPRRALEMSDDEFLDYRFKYRYPLNYIRNGMPDSAGVRCLYNFSSGPSSFIPVHRDILPSYFKNGKYIADSFILPNSGQVARYWSLVGFEKSPPYGMVVVDSRVERFKGFDKILDSYQYYLKEEGDNIDVVQYEKDYQNFRYKELGFIGL